MVVNIKDILNNNSEVEINGQWFPARPINYKYRSFWEKLKEAWLVFKGKADPLVWPYQ